VNEIRIGIGGVTVWLYRRLRFVAPLAVMVEATV
jgi:hypothetical protein